MENHFLSKGQVLLFGHRGYSSLAPENNLSAFRILLEQKIPGAELDVHRCKSGELVVTHDDNLERITGFKGRVAETDFSRIRTLDAGGWFSWEFKGEKIPLLDEVFELLGKNVYYDIELKRMGKGENGLEAEVLSRIRAHNIENLSLLSSFNPWCIRRVNRLAPEIPTAVIYSASKKLPFFLRHGEARFITNARFLKPNYKIIRPWTILVQKKLFKGEVLPWIVNDPQIAEKLLKAGARGIISNDPGKMLVLDCYR
ncbi:MAG: glycerophosphodiester phosphodiesterase [Spirochaeta sp.]|nr:glycerophosphodiester phosphodiesterase [Spirochaeta sp.]